MTDPRTVHEHLTMYRRFLAQEPAADHESYKLQERILAPLTNRPPRALNLASLDIPNEWNTRLQEFLNEHKLKGVISTANVPLLIGQKVLVPVNGTPPIPTSFKCVGGGDWNGPAVASDAGSIYRVPTLDTLSTHSHKWREERYTGLFERAGMFNYCFIGLTSNYGYNFSGNEELPDAILARARMNPGWHLDTNVELSGQEETLTVDLEARLFRHKDKAPIVEKTSDYARLVRLAKES